jgi:hypothetical protein
LFKFARESLKLSRDRAVHSLAGQDIFDRGRSGKTERVGSDLHQISNDRENISAVLEIPTLSKYVFQTTDDGPMSTVYY